MDERQVFTVAEILKITSPVKVNNRIDNLPKKQPTDKIFDLLHPERIEQKIAPKLEKTQGYAGKESLLQDLNKEILLPLLRSTTSQSDAMKRLVSMGALLESSLGLDADGILDKIFLKPHELLEELMKREQGETIFKGEFFDSLRLLARMEGQPSLKEAIVNVLKYFDGYVNQDYSLESILKQSQNLLKNLPKSQAELIRVQVETLSTLIQDKGMNFKEINSFLKNSFVPALGSLIRGFQYSEKTRDQVLDIVHHIVRYDKGDASRLEEAVSLLGEELKQLTDLTEEDLHDMAKLLLQHGKEARENSKETQLSSFLSQIFEKVATGKANGAAQQLLFSLIQSESPTLPLMHFMIPIQFMEENTYGEFFIDKDCEERKGDAKEAKNIFFIIQSDKYGNFEVDLLARDQMIDLEIKCPERLVDAVKGTRGKLKDIIEDQGYRLSGYQVGRYDGSTSILKRFPKLGLRKVGMDVKV